MDSVYNMGLLSYYNFFVNVCINFLCSHYSQHFFSVCYVLVRKNDKGILSTETSMVAEVCGRSSRMGIL